MISVPDGTGADCSLPHRKGEPKMKKWTRIKEQYDGGFAEMYLDLYQYQGTFVIKGTSYHDNAGAENTLCEVVIPNTIKRTEDHAMSPSDAAHY